MLLEKWYQKTAFLIINFPTEFFQAPVLIFTAYQNKKCNKKVVFTGRLQGGVCSLYSIGESLQCIHSLLYVLDNVTNNTSPRTAAYRPIAYLVHLLGVVQHMVFDRFGLAQPHNKCISKAATCHANSTVQAASNNI